MEQKWSRTRRVLDFIDADGVDLAQRAVLQTPGDHVQGDLPRDFSCDA